MSISRGRRALFTKKMEHREKLMSDRYNDLFKENVTFCLDEIWTLNDREDLFDDCVAYVMDELADGVVDGKIGHSHILVATINYFQSISGGAISNADLEIMATNDELLGELKSQEDIEQMAASEQIAYQQLKRIRKKQNKPVLLENMELTE